MSPLGLRLVGIAFIALAIVLGATLGPIAYNESARLRQQEVIKAVEIERRRPDTSPFDIMNWIGPIAIVGGICLLFFVVGFLLACPREILDAPLYTFNPPDENPENYGSSRKDEEG
jgi:hypothetical protein